MVIWKGWGIIGVVFPILVIAILASLDLSDSTVDWLYFIGLTLSAIPVWFIGKHLNRNKDEIFINEKTGQQLRLGNQHSLFFIPLQYYAIVYVILGIAPFFADN